MEHDVTGLLKAAGDGDPGASEQLYAVVYADLRALARRQLRGRGGAAAPQTTSLVHEAYLRLARGAGGYHDRGHFFAIAARAMRQVLIDHVRRRGAAKRGEGAALLDCDGLQLAAEDHSGELLAIDAALQRLESVDPRLARVVEWRFFGGLTLEEIGTALGLSERTIKRDWRLARAFLARELALTDTAA